MTNVSSGLYAFRLGDSFDSYADLLERLEAHSRESFVHYWRRDTRTVEGAVMKTTRPISKSLKYYSVRYACIHGGQKYAARGEGRRQTHSMRSDCPSFIMLRASKCGQQLKVIGVCNDHNHEISESSTRTLPQSRKLVGPTKDEVLEMLHLHVDRKKIIEYVRLTANKHLTVKDLFNMKATHRHELAKRPKITQTQKDAMARKIAGICDSSTEDRYAGSSLSVPVETTYYEIVTELPSFLNNDLTIKDDDFHQTADHVEAGEPCLTNDLERFVVEEDAVEETTATYHIGYVTSPPDDDYTVVDSYTTIVELSDEQIAVEMDSEPVSSSPSNADVKILPKRIRRRRTPSRNHRHRRAAGTIYKCGHCCLNAQYMRKRIDVLTAKERKLIEETHVLRLTKERLIAEAGT